MDYLENGGRIYFESVDIGNNYTGTEFFEHFGITYIDDGGEQEVTKVKGNQGYLTAGMKIEYSGGYDPHFSVDRLGADEATLLFSSEDGFGRMFLYENGNYKAISSSIILGAMTNSDTINMKPFLVSEMVNYFMDFDPSTSLTENVKDLLLWKNYPNPFSRETTIAYTIQESGSVEIGVYSADGRLIRQLVSEDLTPGNYSVIWDATDGNGKLVKNGFYFYKISVGHHSKAEKMILLR
jgi:hypothetical protein